eukprot:9354261-Lingulodinium_polyedra.AAC.1
MAAKLQTRSRLDGAHSPCSCVAVRPVPARWQPPFGVNHAWGPVPNNHNTFDCVVEVVAGVLHSQIRMLITGRHMTNIVCTMYCVKTEAHHLQRAGGSIS